MKKIIAVTAIAAIVAFTWSCSHKTTPAQATTSSTDSTTKNVTAATGDATMGQATYTAKCNRCHGLKDPANFTAKDWVPILNNMAAKAHLDDTEKSNVLAYVLANAKQG